MPGLDGVELKHLETTAEAGEFMTWLGERRPVLGFDTETGGLRWWDDALRLVQFGDARTGWVMSYRDWRGVVAEALRAYARPIVAHNLPFDAKFAIREGLTVKRHLYHDTFPMHHVLDPPAPHGLKPLSTGMIDPYAHAGEAALHDGMRQQGWTWATVPETFAPYIWYSALDGVLVAQLYEVLWPQIVAAGLEAQYELELGNAWATGVDASMRGMAVDVEYAREAQAHLRARADEIRGGVRVEYGLAIGSGKDVTARLIEDGIELTEQTAGGAWKLDKDVLESLSGAHPLVDLVTEYKQALKFSASYYGGVLDRVTPGGIIHADINSLGARTSRMSVSKPALQQIPSKDWRPRRMFVPRARPDERTKAEIKSGVAPLRNVLLSGDLSNIEPRIMAHMAQEPTMLEAFRRGEDVHMFMARHMYPGLPSEDDAPECKVARKKSKSGSLGKMYFIGAEKFAKQQGVSESEAKRFLAFYDETFPAIKEFSDDVMNIARERYARDGLAWVRDFTGRVHTLTPLQVRWDEYYPLINYVVQGPAAQLLKRAAVRLAQTEYGQYYVMPVHDEFLLDVPEEYAEDAGITLREILVNCADGQLTVPLEADIEIYRDSWAQSVDGAPGAPKVTLAEWSEMRAAL